MTSHVLTFMYKNNDKNLVMFSSSLVRNVLEYTDVNGISLSVFTFKNLGLF